MKRSSVAVLVFGLAFAPKLTRAEVQLKPETLEGFSQYVQATEARIDKELAQPGAFLYIDRLPEARKREVARALIRGQAYIERLETLDAAGREITTPGGLIHHWIGLIFIPKATLGQALDLVQDYNHHRDIYQPEVVRSNLISRNGDEFKIYYRLRKKKVVTVTLNTQHDVRYTLLDSKRACSRSHSTWITEVQNADQPGERDKPIGYDSGYLWRMNSYWRFEERDGGVYVQSESVSLTRDIPAGLGWLIRRFVAGIPKDSLQMTLGSTRAALLGRIEHTGSSERAADSRSASGGRDLE